MKNFCSLDAFQLYRAGWVATVYHFKTLTATFVFKADVKPSMRVNDVPHHPWIAVKCDGMVMAGHCDCLAGLGDSCSNVAALLFKLEAVVRLGFTSQACTNVPCEWNNYFVKKVACEVVNLYQKLTFTVTNVLQR